MTYRYNAHFMAYADQSSKHSAQTISDLLRRNLEIQSVLDVGCARGTWLAAWRESGATDIVGADGSYVDPTTLAIPRNLFVAADLAETLDLGRRFDLVQSLEVAEHVCADAANRFVDNLVRHAHGYILFSAAPPGQGGEHHINEQPYEYWREKFRARGFHPYDFIRPALAADKGISFWYRYNTMLYVREDRAADLPQQILATRISESQSIADVSPLAFRIRKTIVRALPYAMQQSLAQLKARTQRHDG